MQESIEENHKDFDYNSSYDFEFNWNQGKEEVTESSQNEIQQKHERIEEYRTWIEFVECNGRRCCWVRRSPAMAIGGEQSGIARGVQLLCVFFVWCVAYSRNL